MEFSIGKKIVFNKEQKFSTLFFLTSPFPDERLFKPSNRYAFELSLQFFINDANIGHHTFASMIVEMGYGNRDTTLSSSCVNGECICTRECLYRGFH